MTSSVARSRLRAPECLVVAAVVAATACASPDRTADTPRDEWVTDEALPVIQVLEGTFRDGELSFRTLPLRDADTGDDRVGVAIEALDGVSFITVSGSSRRIAHGVGGTPPWTSSDVASCGPIPSAALVGECVSLRARNDTTDQLERVYFELTSLSPSGTTTSVAPHSPQPFAASPDFGIGPTIPNGLVRIGELGRSSPTTGGQAIWWSFAGTTTSTRLTFTFLVRVHGLVVRPTQRASLATGQIDDPNADYPARTTVTPSAANLSISEDGRYVAFATASSVLRKDLLSGALTTVASGCTTASHPHLSADGGTVVFQAAGCDLSGVGATAAAPQIYAHDFATGLTELVSRTPSGAYASGTSQLPRTSSDGRVVVFQSAAADLIAGAPASRRGCVEVYRFDRATAVMSHVSAGPSGWDTGCTAAASAGLAPDVSRDGNLVVFTSARPLDASDTDARSDVYVYDHPATFVIGAAVVYRVSVTDTGAPFTSGSSSGATISEDGMTVAFGTDATNVISGTTTSSARRHIYRRSSARFEHASIVRIDRRVDGGEPSRGAMGIPELSRTGRFVAFWSAATDLASNGSFAPSGSQVYVCDAGAPSTLARCWVASTMQTSASSAFSVLSGAVSSSTRIGLAYPSDEGAGYVAYQAAPLASTWASAGGAGQQIFVSPIGDPRYQQVPNTP